MLDYIIIGLLIIVIILVIIAISKNVNEGKITERLGTLETTTVKELSSFQIDIMKTMNDNFNGLNDRMEKKLTQINDKVNERLDDNFAKTNRTFTNKKSRGIFGEINLKHILVSIFGEKNDNVYRLQYTFPNTTIADAVIFAPEPLGTVAIDSKFPLEHYQKMVDKNLPQVDRNIAEKEFKVDVKKHIDAIASKYIIPGVTSDQAIMFLPAEALFAEINAYHTDLIVYAHKRRVWICSPTTLISTFTIIEVLLKNMERDKYASIIHDELNKLGIEFGRYKERWDKLSRSIETVNKDIENIHVTTDKISKRFDSISKVELGDKKEIE